MPGGMSGFDLGAQLNREAPGLRVVYTSGYSPEIAGRGEELIAGVNFLPKPFAPDLLLRTVRAGLDRPKSGSGDGGGDPMDLHHSTEIG